MSGFFQWFLGMYMSSLLRGFGPYGMLRSTRLDIR